MLITDTLYIIYCTYEYERIALGFEDLKTVYKLLPVFFKSPMPVEGPIKNPFTVFSYLQFSLKSLLERVLGKSGVHAQLSGENKTLSLNIIEIKTSVRF